MEKVKLSISDVTEFHGLTKKDGRFNTQERNMIEQILNTDPELVKRFLNGQMVDKRIPIVDKALKGELVERDLVRNWAIKNAEEKAPKITDLMELIGPELEVPISDDNDETNDLSHNAGAFRL